MRAPNKPVLTMLGVVLLTPLPLSAKRPNVTSTAP